MNGLTVKPLISMSRAFSSSFVNNPSAGREEAQLSACLSQSRWVKSRSDATASLRETDLSRCRHYSFLYSNRFVRYSGFNGNNYVGSPSDVVGEWNCLTGSGYVLSLMYQREELFFSILSFPLTRFSNGRKRNLRPIHLIRGTGHNARL